jgi:hypothetical protein
MQPTVVYVHSHGNKPTAAALKRTWDEALFGRPVGDRSRMAYWSDLGHPAPLPDPGADELETAPADEGMLDEELRPAELIIEAVLQAHAETLVETPAPVGGVSPDDGVPGAALDPWLREMAFVADAVVRGEAEAAGKAPPLPRSARVALFRALVTRTFADVYAYFFGGFADAAQERVRAALDAENGPAVVVAHGLGAIIAYDVLRVARPTREVPLLVTCGSPLAVPEIQGLLPGPLRVPGGVKAWRNIVDGRDLVALGRTIRPEYLPTERTTDFLVVNDSDNHHGIREYLATAPVRSAVTALVM